LSPGEDQQSIALFILPFFSMVISQQSLIVVLILDMGMNSEHAFSIQQFQSCDEIESVLVEFVPGFRFFSLIRSFVFLKFLPVMVEHMEYLRINETTECPMDS
jgi:hypothetical protein